MTADISALVDKRIVRVPWYSSSTNTLTDLHIHQCVCSDSPILKVISRRAYGLVYLVQRDWQSVHEFPRVIL